MKITGIEIEHFGPWDQLSLPLASDGLTVISGANESGKSALRRFIRSVLFGFASEDTTSEFRTRRRPHAGSLRVKHHGRAFEIRRAAHDGSSGFVTSRLLTPYQAPSGHVSGHTTAGPQSLIEHCDFEIDDEDKHARGNTLANRSLIREEDDPEFQTDTTRNVSSPLATESAADEPTRTWGDEHATLPLADALSDILGDLSEKLFDEVFSLGLRQLHELSALNDDDVARAIHGETLGPYGQTLLSARDESQAHVEQLWDDTRQEALPRLLARFEQLNDQIQSQQRIVERYSHLVRSRRQHERRLAELQSRRSNLQNQLLGYTHIERVWTPWQRLRNLQAELLRLPRIDDFPEGGIDRFDHIEQELHTALKCRDALLSEAKQFHRDAKKIAVPHELRRCSAAMRGLLDQREHVARLEERARQSHTAMKAQKDKLDAQTLALGADWTLTRLEALDTSVAAHYRLVEKARQFRRAISRRNRWKQRLQRLSQQSQQHQIEIDQALRKLGGVSLEDALRQARRRKAAANPAPTYLPNARSAAISSGLDPEVEHLQMRIVELEQRRISVSRQIERLEPKLILPTWVMFVLGFFGLGGVSLAIIGLITGVLSSAIGGAAYALLGTAFGGLSLSLKMHFEQQVRDSIGQLHEELRDNEIRLREARDAWQRLTGTESNFTSIPRMRMGTKPVMPAAIISAATAAVMLEPESDSINRDVVGLADSLATMNVVELNAVELNAVEFKTANAVESATEELSVEDLERLVGLQQQVAKSQRKRGLWNDRFRAAAHELTSSRQQWCSTLTQLGLPESVRVTETFDLWQRLAAANEQRKTWLSAESDFKRHLENLQNIRSQVVEILNRLSRRDLDQKPTSEVFTMWDEDLQQLQAKLQERLRLRNEERRRRAEAAEYHEKIEDLRLQRSALLRQGCATDRDDYERRATIVARHEEIHLLIAETKEELEAAGRLNPDMAIVEDDLLRFDSSQHGTTLSRLRREADDTDHEIESLHEELGRARHEIEQLEADDEPADLRLEREILRSQIQAAAEEWLADEWNAATLDGIRARYERVCQPGILAAASRYFARLTEGRYRTLWTPLRHRSLRVDDASGTTWRLDQLSSSARERLLLAIRMALIDDFAQRGFNLPLLLDDVLLTLDPAQAAVAANELTDFARRGHQVLFFTCHPHLATLFTASGCPNIRLSQFAAATERLAG